MLSDLTEGERTVVDELLKGCRRMGPDTQLFIVGGWVRDTLMGIPPNDIDFVLSGGDLTQFKDKLCSSGRLFQHSYENVIKRDGEKYPVLHLQFPIGWVDIAQCAGINDLKHDQERRDFTINSLYVNCVTGELIDPFGGVADIQSKTLRSVHLTLGRPLPLVNAIRGIQFKISKGMITEETTEAALYGPSIEKYNPQKAVFDIKKSFSSIPVPVFLEALIHYRHFNTLFGDYPWDLNSILEHARQIEAVRGDDDPFELHLAGIFMHAFRLRWTEKEMRPMVYGTSALDIAMAAHFFRIDMTRDEAINWMEMNSLFWKRALKVLMEPERTFAQNMFIQKQ